MMPSSGVASASSVHAKRLSFKSSPSGRASNRAFSPINSRDKLPKSGSTGSLGGMGWSFGQRGPTFKIWWLFYAAIALMAAYHFLWAGSSQERYSEVSRRNLKAGRSPTGIATGKKKYAYCTLLCDDIMAEATMVMLHSVKRTGTPHDMVILTLNVSNRTLDSLRALGATIWPITKPVPYPFAVTADRAAINKPCRYSKMLMWSMTEYAKLIYLDGDLLILKNIDDLFERPQMAAAPDTLPPDKFNSGLMVVEPNTATFDDMLSKVATLLSPNVGDQGFLNSYFANWYQQGPEHHIDYTYNALVRISVNPGWKQFIAPDLRILHFSGNTKPWNMMVDKQFPTTRQYDPRWWEVYDSMYGVLHQRAQEAAQAARHKAGRGKGTNSSRMLNVEPLKPPPQLAEQCKRDYMAYTRGLLVPNKVSVVINCFDRFDLLKYFIKRYASFDFVHKVYLVWGNTRVTPFLPPEVQNLTTPVEILYTGVDSLNDRFLPIKSLETEAILLCDDDIEVNAVALRLAFERWQEDKFRLVGFFPRSHFREVEGTRKGQLSYVLTPKQEYSIVLTKMFLVHAEYLRAYTCLVPQRLRDYVDENKNCEDIAMNFLVTQLSGLPPLFFYDPTKLDYGTSSGLSSRGSHDVSRSVCMEDIAIMLGYMSLRNTTEAMTTFERDKMVKVVRRRRLSTSAHMVFQPIFDAFERTGSRQFMKSVTFNEELTMTEMAQVPEHSVNNHVMCVKGNNDEDLEDSTRNMYTLLDFASVPPDAGHLSGTTFIAHNSGGFQNRFTLLHTVSSFAVWRRRHGCFGPARLMLFQDGAMKTQLDGWASMLLKAVLGPGAFPPYRPQDDATPQCLERAVVVRQRDTYNADECSVDAQEIRRVVRTWCKEVNKAVPEPTLWNDKAANVRVAFVGSGESWDAMPWFNLSVAASWIQPECAIFGLSCEVKTVPPGEFCSTKVLGMGQADLVIGPWGDKGMDNIIFLRPGTTVLELYGENAVEEELKLARAEAECLDLAYDQMKHSAGMRELLTWVGKQLEVLGRRTKKDLEENKYKSFLESCVSKKLRF